METPTKPMTGKEKVRRLLDVKLQADQKARDAYANDPGVRAMVERLKAKTEQKFGRQ